MIDTIILIISATVESLGFALLFRVRKDRLLYTSIGGMITIAFYLLIYTISEDIFVSNLIAGIFATTYSEILARLLKAPAIVFLFPSVIPLVPGGSLYYTMSAYIANDKTECLNHLQTTVSTAIGVAVSIILVSICTYYITLSIKKYKYYVGIRSHK